MHCCHREESWLSAALPSELNTTEVAAAHQNIYLKLDVNSKSEALEKIRALDMAS